MLVYVSYKYIIIIISIKKITKSDIINSNDIIAYETSHEFFSTINSKKTLSLVIDTIFEVTLEATKKSKAIESFQSKDGVYAKIWELYKHSEEKRKEKEQSRVAGNHVRKVVKPMEDRLRRVDTRLKGVEQKIDKMEDDMKEIKNLLLKIANK